MTNLYPVMTGKSNCCNAGLKVEGDRTTHYYVCLGCGKACDRTVETSPYPYTPKKVSKIKPGGLLRND